MGGRTDVRSAFDVYDHHTVADLLGAWQRERPRQRTDRALAAKLALSHTFVGQVRRGDRCPRPEQADHWASGMGLEPDEAAYWACLVRQESAHVASERQEAAWEAEARRVLSRRVGAELTPLLASAQGQVLVEAARVGVHLPTPLHELAAMMKPVPSLDELQAAIVAAQETKESFATLPRIRHPDMARAVTALHRDALHQAEASLDHDPAASHHFASLVVALPSSALPEVAQRLRDALLHALGPWLDGRGADRVFQIGLHVVPRTESLDVEP